jgi:hypothetical protein
MVIRNNERRVQVKTEAREMIQRASAELGVPQGVAQQALLDSEGVNPQGRKLSAQEVAAKWGIAEDKMKSLKESCGGDFAPVRQQLGNRMMVMLAIAQDDLLSDLMDNEVMKTQTPEQKARLVKALSDSLVTVQDGHTPAVNLNLGTAVETMKKLDGLKAAIKTA